MNAVRLTSTQSYRSPLRESQARSTRERIAEAAFEVFRTLGSQDDITFKGVAKKAGVTEMTVYRHFPNREDLLQALWGRINSSMGVPIPESVEAMLGSNQKVLQAFEENAPLMLAGIMSRQGREMRLSRKAHRQKSYLKIAAEVNPALSPKRKKQLAAVLQLLQSTHAWDSLRSNWDLNPKESAEATRSAIEALIAAARKEKS